MEGVNEVSLNLKQGLRNSTRNDLAQVAKAQQSINKPKSQLISTEKKTNKHEDNNQQTSLNIEQFNPESILVSFIAKNSITINDQKTFLKTTDNPTNRQHPR